MTQGTLFARLFYVTPRPPSGRPPPCILIPPRPFSPRPPCPPPPPTHTLQDVNCVRWHPTDPTLLASAGDDGRVKLWRCLLPPSAADDAMITT